MKTTGRFSTPAGRFAWRTLFAGCSLALAILLASPSSSAYAQRGPYDFSGHSPSNRNKMLDEDGRTGRDNLDDDESDNVNDGVDSKNGNNSSAKGSNNPGNMGPPCTPQHQVNCKGAAKK